MRAGELHGPYFYYFVRVNGALVKRYIKAKDASSARAACDARRQEEREQSEAIKNSRRQWSELIEQLRESEQLLLQTLEMHHGKKN